MYQESKKCDIIANRSKLPIQNKFKVRRYVSTNKIFNPQSIISSFFNAFEKS